MKKVVGILSVALSLSAVAELKIGVVDMMLLVRNHPQYESNRTLLTSTEADYKKRLDAMKSDLDSIQDEGRKLADELRNPMLAEAAKKKLENRLVDIQTRYMKQQQTLRSEAMRNQQELQDLEARVLKQQASDLKKRVADYAKRAGYEMILDASAAIHFDEKFDVTDAILKEMGVDPKKAKTISVKEKDESK